MQPHSLESIAELATAVRKDPDLKKEIAADPEGALSRIAATPLQTDKVIYRIVVSALGGTALIALIGAIIITLSDPINDVPRAIPEILLALGSAAVGALAGLLAPAPGRR